MTFELWLGIVNLVISLAGLLAGLRLFRSPRTKVQIWLVVIVSMLVLLSVFAVYHTSRHEMQVERVSHEILQVLGNETLTFDQVYDNLLFRPSPIVNEALNDLVTSGEVGHRFLQLRNDTGGEIRVRGYYRK